MCVFVLEKGLFEVDLGPLQRVSSQNMKVRGGVYTKSIDVENNDCSC